VKLVVPFAPSATPVCVTTTPRPGMQDATLVVKLLLSEIWNS
jgi:hypothetical protein